MRLRACPGRLLIVMALAVVVLGLSAPGVMAEERQQAADFEREFQKLQDQPVYDGSVCLNTCHADIADTDNYGDSIIFSHGYHQVVSCSGCHSEFPHRVDKTVDRPSMQTCFNCHGLRHGSAGIVAEGQCEGCHKEPLYRMRPSFHGSDWAAKPHVAPAEEEFNTRCAMCHEPSSCTECHDEKGVEWEPLAWDYDAGDGCLACHGGSALTVRAANVAISGLDGSAHSEVVCQDCHPDYRYDDAPGETKMWQVNAGLACQECHAASDEKRLSAPVAKYEGSVHGELIAEGDYDGATCASCHGGHAIKRTDTTVAREELHLSSQSMCGGCHVKEYDSYDDAYHGQAYKTGAADAPACWTCHNSHAVGAIKSPSSSMYEANRDETCGKKGCHAGADDSFGIEYGSLIHIGSKDKSLLEMIRTGISDE